MATLRIYTGFECDLNGIKYSGGSRSTPVEITVTEYMGGVISLATATTLDLWSSASAVTTFDYFFIKCDQDIRIELTVDRGAEVGTILIPLLVEANTPFQLIYDDALANYTANFATGSADIIDRIRIRNVSGVTTSGAWALFT